MNSDNNDEKNDTDPLVPPNTSAAATQLVSSRTGVPFDRTVRAMLNSQDPQKQALALNFLRKVLALLVLQYTAVLMIVSPFCLLDNFKTAIQPYVLYLSVASFAGIVWSVALVIRKGSEKWYARTSLFCTTAFFALALGLKLSMVPWSNYALVALGQAVANFAFLHALTQFDTHALKWLNYKTAPVLLFGLAVLWMCLLREAKSSWLVSCCVPLGGWLYAVSIIYAVRKATAHREPNDYLRATIFILGPPVPDCLIPKKPRSSGWTRLRTAHCFVSKRGTNRGGTASSTMTAQEGQDETVEKTATYGGVDGAAEEV